MLRPRVPIASYADAAREMVRIARQSRLDAAPSPRLRFAPDKRGDQAWQSPEETESRGVGSCDDLAIRYLRYLGRRRPMRIVLGRSPADANTIHVWLEEEDGQRIDPSIPAGMSNPYGENLYQEQLAMAVITPEMFEADERTEGVGEYSPMQRFREVTEDDRVLAAFASLLTMDADPLCSMAAVNALRLVLGWEAHDPASRSLDAAELLRLSGKLDPWVDGMTVNEINGARGAVDLVRSMGDMDASEFELVQESMAEPAQSLASCLLRAAFSMAALGLLSAAAPSPAEHTEGHGAGEACPDPSHCDCAPCSAANAAAAQEEQTAGLDWMSGPSVTWNDGAADALLAGRRGCATGSCPI